MVFGHIQFFLVRGNNLIHLLFGKFDDITIYPRTVMENLQICLGILVRCLAKILERKKFNATKRRTGKAQLLSIETTARKIGYRITNIEIRIIPLKVILIAPTRKFFIDKLTILE